MSPANAESPGVRGSRNPTDVGTDAADPYRRLNHSRVTPTPAGAGMCGERAFSHGQPVPVQHDAERLALPDSVWLCPVHGAVSPTHDPSCNETIRRYAASDKRERALVEFDSWLSCRGEFGEVLTAFRQAFGTDTSAKAVTS